MGLLKIRAVYRTNNNAVLPFKDCMITFLTVSGLLWCIPLVYQYTSVTINFMDDADIFCQIAQGSAEAYVFWEDDDFMAFLDIHPSKTGHSLVIPKQHVDYFWNMDDIHYGQLMLRVKWLATRMKEIAASDYVFVRLVGTDVPHVHAHIVPEKFPGFDRDNFQAISEHLKGRIQG